MFKGSSSAKQKEIVGCSLTGLMSIVKLLVFLVKFSQTPMTKKNDEKVHVNSINQSTISQKFFRIFSLSTFIFFPLQLNFMITCNHLLTGPEKFCFDLNHYGNDDFIIELLTHSFCENFHNGATQHEQEHGVFRQPFTICDQKAPFLLYVNCEFGFQVHQIQQKNQAQFFLARILFI